MHSKIQASICVSLIIKYKYIYCTNVQMDDYLYKKMFKQDSEQHINLQQIVLEKLSKVPRRQLQYPVHCQARRPWKRIIFRFPLSPIKCALLHYLFQIRCRPFSCVTNALVRILYMSINYHIVNTFCQCCAHVQRYHE